MKKLCIQVCEKAQMTVEITPEMEIDFFECWVMVEYGEEPKDCETCSWYGLNVASRTSLCQMVEERCSREGRIIWED